MMRQPLFLAYGTVLLGLLGMAEYRGWSLLRVNQLKDVPKTVRDNPGAYRSHYRYLPRYIGGK
jgi:hypothetical protein